ncbi:MAG: glutamate synthase central domain-containing protein [Edaphobacter sp.]
MRIFRQRFAQVTNPPIDSLRESMWCLCIRGWGLASSAG